MDFFERFLQISPDANAGTAELIWLALLAVVLYVLRRIRYKTRLRAAAE